MQRHVHFDFVLRASIRSVPTTYTHTHIRRVSSLSSFLASSFSTRAQPTTTSSSISTIFGPLQRRVPLIVSASRPAFVLQAQLSIAPAIVPFLTSITPRRHPTPFVQTTSLLPTTTTTTSTTPIIISTTRIMAGPSPMRAPGAPKRRPEEEKKPPSLQQQQQQQQQRRKKQKPMSPEIEVRLAIQMAAREGSVDTGLAAYDRAKEQGLRLSLDSYATLLFLCSGGDDWEALIGNTATEKQKEMPSPESLLERSEAVMQDMATAGITPNEICYTALARLNAWAGRVDTAFEIAQRVTTTKGLVPRLRCFTPSLVAYAEQGQGEQAFAVDGAIVDAGLEPGEGELSRLLQASSSETQCNGFYERVTTNVLLRLSRNFTTLERNTINRAIQYFTSLDQSKWRIDANCKVEEDGGCEGAGPGVKLAALDLDDEEYGEFTRGIAELATKQQRHAADFTSFKGWLEEHGPFGVVVDAANVAFYGQNFESGGFSFGQIGAVVQRVRRDHPRLKPLVLLHVNRTKAQPAQQPTATALLEQLKKESCFYATPQGSNDDWYWMYAAVAAGAEGLLVSNDEMRDHSFSMLAPRFFGKWKQRHQLRYTFSGGPDTLEFVYPPPFTTCLQEIASGGEGDKDKKKKGWVLPCVDGTWTLIMQT